MLQRLSLRLVLARTPVRVEADAVNVTTANEEQVNLRKTLRETVREGEGDGGRTAPAQLLQLTEHCQCSFLLVSSRAHRISDFRIDGCRERESKSKSKSVSVSVSASASASARVRVRVRVRLRLRVGAGAGK